MFKQALPALEVAEHRGSGYPEPFRSRMGDRVKHRLGDHFGLAQFGVNLVRLGPGGQSALRHFHSHEDELVYVVEGELTLITNTGRQRVTAGMCVGFPANVSDAHHLVNEGDAPASYLEIGARIPADAAHYPDDDLCLLPDGKGDHVPAHKDGRHY